MTWRIELAAIAFATHRAIPWRDAARVDAAVQRLAKDQEGDLVRLKDQSNSCQTANQPLCHLSQLRSVRRDVDGLVRLSPVEVIIGPRWSWLKLLDSLHFLFDTKQTAGSDAESLQRQLEGFEKPSTTELMSGTSHIAI